MVRAGSAARQQRLAQRGFLLTLRQLRV